MIKPFIYAFMVSAAIFTGWLIGWNRGWEVGAQYGYDTAVISGKLIVEVKCK